MRTLNLMSTSVVRALGRVFLMGGLVIAACLANAAHAQSNLRVIHNPQPGPDIGSFGQSIALDGDRMVVGAPGLLGDGAACVYQLNPEGYWELEDYLVPEGPYQPGRVGFSVSISGDLIVLGGPNSSVLPFGQGGVFHEGAVWAFRKVDSDWVQEQVLFRPGGGSISEHFGSSVSVLGDSLLIGAEFFAVPLEGGGVVWNSGGVFAYSRTENGWKFDERIDAPTTTMSGRFGASIVQNEGTAYITAIRSTENPSGQGAVFVLENGDDGWSHIQSFYANQAGNPIRFGESLAVDGETMVVGAPGVDETTLSHGAAFVFKRTGGVWNETLKLVDPSPTNGSHFGESVSVAGDSMLIGAPGKGLYGSVFVYQTPENEWALMQEINGTAISTQGELGAAVAASEDILVLGAPEFEYSGPHWRFSGAVAVMKRDGPNWAVAYRLEERGPSNDQFGTSIAISGNTLAVGAPFDDVLVGNSGSVHLFVRSGVSWAYEETISASTPSEDQLFGHSIDLDGDILVVGAPGKYASVKGAAYVFKREGGIWSEVQKFESTFSGTTQRFGSAVALDGDRLVIGAGTPMISTLPTPPPPQASAYVYVLSGGVWAEEARLVASDVPGQGGFGNAVAIEGDLVVVGSTKLFGVPVVTGGAYLFTRSGSVWSESTKLGPSPSQPNTSSFGSAVAIYGDVIVVGAPEAGDGPNFYRGSVDVFRNSGSGWILEATLTGTEGSKYQSFGTSVALADHLLLVGASGSGTQDNPSRPLARVFSENGGSWVDRGLLDHPIFDGYATTGSAVALEGSQLVVGAPRNSSHRMYSGAILSAEYAPPPSAAGSGWDLLE